MVGISQIHHKDTIVFGIRGSGKDYSEVYEHLYKNYTTIEVKSDMPWHYFRLSKMEENKFISDMQFIKYNSEADISYNNTNFNQNDW
jgi:hypothetical protein